MNFLSKVLRGMTQLSIKENQRLPFFPLFSDTISNNYRNTYNHVSSNNDKIATR